MKIIEKNTYILIPFLSKIIYPHFPTQNDELWRNFQGGYSVHRGLKKRMWSHLRIKPLSCMQSTHIKKYLRFYSEHGIGAVITAIKGKNLADKIPKHIEYLYVPVVDHESCNISVFFKDSFEFIEEERKRTNVLVHCMAGVSRSVTLVIAYIM